MLRSDQLLCGGPCFFVNFLACQHARDLLAASAAVERLRAGPNRDILAGPAIVFLKPEMRVRVRGDLRLMGDCEHWRAAAEPHQPLPYGRGGRTANAGVDFVEHEDRGGCFLGEHDFECKQEPRQLAARGHLH